MTPHAVAALDYIREYIADGGCAPTLAQIARHLGLPSRSNAHGIVKILVRDGKLVRQGVGQRRGLTLPEQPDLTTVPVAAIRRELARRGLTLEALDDHGRIADAYAPRCAVDGCSLPVQRGHLMCRDHRHAVDRDLQAEVFRAHGIARRTRRSDDANAYGEAVRRATALAGQRVGGR